MIRSLLAAESAPPSKTASKSPSLKWLIASFTVPVGVTKNPEDCQMLLLDSNSHGSKPIASTTVIGIGTSDTGPFTSSLGDRSINGRFDTCLSSSRRKSPAGVRTACNVGISVTWFASGVFTANPVFHAPQKDYFRIGDKPPGEHRWSNPNILVHATV